MAQIRSADADTGNGRTQKGAKLLPERLLRWMADKSWQYVFALWLGVFVVGLIGFWTEYHSSGRPYSFWGLVYLASQLLLLNSGFGAEPLNSWLELARIFAPIAVLLTAAKALARIFEEQLQLFILRVFYKGHVVVCGLGRKGWLFVKEFREKGERVVVIEKDVTNEMLAQCESILVTVLIGYAEDPTVLDKANVALSKRVICVCGEDGTNVEIAVRTRKLVEHRKGVALTCLVHVFSPELCNLLRAKIIEMGKLDAFRLEFFNIFQSAAWLLLKDWEPAVRKGIEDVPAPHFLVVGLGWFGESLVVHAARKWWEAEKDTGKCLRVTCVDVQADRLVPLLYSRHETLESLCEINATGIDIESAEFEEAGFLEGDDGRAPVTKIFVCIDNQPLALAAAIKLVQKTQNHRISVVVRLDDKAGFAQLLLTSSKDAPYLESIVPFGLFQETCTIDSLHRTTVETLATESHNVYVAGQRLPDGSMPKKPNVVPWEKLPEDKKESNRSQADQIGEKLRRVKCSLAPRTNWDGRLTEFTDEEVEILAIMEHERWFNELTEKGWRHGTVRDDANKIHDCLVSWDELDEKNREIDRIYVRSLPKFLARIGLDIYRMPEKSRKEGREK